MNEDQELTESQQRQWDIAFLLLEPIREAIDLRSPAIDHFVHYSTFAGLEGMVGSKELWFSPITLMNDVEEIETGKRLIVDNAEDGRSAANAIEALSVNEPEFWNLASQAFRLRRDLDRTHTFISCWSECDLSSSSHDDLAMWRGYGGDGEGVGIVVPADALHLSVFRPDAVVALPVEYETEAEFAARAANYFKTFAINYLGLSTEERKEHLALTAGLFNDLCYYLALSHKHVGFRGEKEWRLVWRRNPHQPTPFDEYVSTRAGFERLCVPIEKGAGVDYWFHLGDVASVMVGPCRDAAERQRAIRTLFRSAVPDLDLTHSTIPYRKRR
jgi:hypothetical protein